MEKEKGLKELIKWILDSVAPSDVDPFSLKIRHSLSGEHWIDTVITKYKNIGV